MTTRKTAVALVGAAVSMALWAGAVYAQQAARTAGRGGIAAGLDLPPAPIYALTSDNAIYVLRQNSGQYVRLGRVNPSDGGNFIGIDFRPADATPNRLYGLTDRGGIYNIVVGANNFGNATLVSTMNPRFSGGFSGLIDFNPVVNALRVIGSNDQNLAVVNSAGGANLGTVAPQTKLAYAAGDVNAGKDPEIIGGSYTNNFVGATATLFYAVDHDLDTLVTIADKTATGSSNTGGGQLQTIGNFFDQNGNRLNMSPTTDLDIYTARDGTNYLVGQTTRLLFSIDLSQINQNLALGRTQRVIVKRGPPAPLPGSNSPLTGGVFDIAIPPAP
jgi:hypothetical protein